MREVQCGFLTYHPRHADMPNVVRYKGQWMPEALATGMVSKRFTDAELAAEHWASHGEANAVMTGNPPILFSRRRTLKRFAENPHYDDHSISQ